MIQKCLVYCCFLLVLPASSFGVPRWAIVEIHYARNTIVDSATLSQALQSLAVTIPESFGSAGELLLGVQHIEEILLHRYATAGFYKARMDSARIGLVLPTDSSKGFALTVSVYEGAKYSVGQIELKGSSQFTSADLLQQFQMRPGQILDEQLLQNDIDDALKRYELIGYPFAKVSIASIIPNDSSHEISIHLSLEEGKRARIGRIVTLGNQNTGSEVITRELRIPIGSYYDAGEIERARSRVERLGFFETVEEPELYLINDSTVAIVVRVKEANTSTIDGVVGYNPGRSNADRGYVNGFVDLAFRNISGTGRNGSLSYSHETQNSQQLGVRYLEPWLFHFPLNVSLSFLERQQDSTYVRTDLGAEFVLLFSEDIAINATLGLDRVIPTDLPDQSFTAFDSRTFTTGLGGTFDTRDNVVAPIHGVLASLGASYGAKSLYGPTRFLTTTTSTNVGIRTIFIDASFYFPTVSDRFIAAIGIHAHDVSAIGDSLESSDLVRLGGVRSLRGYREADFLISRYAYANLEYRAMTGRASFLFVFSDVGYLFRDAIRDNASEQTLYPVSYGIGAQVESPLGILSVSVGLAKGEPLDQAKLHFGLIKQF
jgi:translocation and assembly module TamA